MLLGLAATLAVLAGPGSASTAASPPANTAAPTISGTPRVGVQLRSSHGSWTNSPTGYTYQWQRCGTGGIHCSAIRGATGREYTLTSQDVGHRDRVVVIASNSAGSGTAASRPTSTVRGAGSTPANTSRPTISGDPKDGSTLTVGRGTYSGSQSITYSYQWQRCDQSGAACASISGATGTSYNVTSGDVGHTLRVVETAKNSHGSTSATSSQTAVVAPAKAGGAALPVSGISLPDRLVIDKVSFSPNPIRSRRPVVARFHVSDLRGFSIQGALVYALGLPYSWVGNAPESPTDGNGFATIILRPTSALPLRRGESLVVFVRARKPGENLLAGVSTRRLVQASVSSPR